MMVYCCFSVDSLFVLTNFEDFGVFTTQSFHGYVLRF